MHEKYQNRISCLLNYECVLSSYFIKKHIDILDIFEPEPTVDVGSGSKKIPLKLRYSQNVLEGLRSFVSDSEGST